MEADYLSSVSYNYHAYVAKIYVQRLATVEL